MMRAIDWGATPLGPVASWPQSLRTALSMMLGSRFAMAVAWGPELRCFYNDRCRPLLGYRHPRALGAPAAASFSERWHAIGPELERVRRGEVLELEGWSPPLERGGRRERAWLTASCSPIRDESGGIGGLFAVVAQPTGRAPGEQRRVRADDALARWSGPGPDRTIGRALAEQLVAHLGHELRNPLNAIMMSAQLVQRRATSDELARPAARIVASGDRMRRMIDQLLDLARIRVAGGLRLSPGPIDLGELCRHVLDELRAAHPGASLELVAGGGLLGRWDGDRLAQVLSNLAGNALAHGEPSAPVRVRLDGHDPERVSIRVENLGAIPEALLPLLFDPLRTAAHRGAKARGLGLGLYISHAIIAAHHGTLAVRSSLEGGTCFEIELPKREELAGR